MTPNEELKASRKFRVLTGTGSHVVTWNEKQEDRPLLAFGQRSVRTCSGPELGDAVVSVILLSLYPGVSAECSNCSMYFEFSLLEPISGYDVKFHILALTDNLTTCTLDFGDLNPDLTTLPPGLTNKHVLHTYDDAGIYDVILDCVNISKYLPITVESSSSPGDYEVKYSYISSTLDITLNLTLASQTSSCTTCDIYIDRLNTTSLNVTFLMDGFSETLEEPGFHDIGVYCYSVNDPEIIYREETIHVYDPCFEEKLFPSFPWTSERNPFEIYEDSHLTIDVVSKPVKCATETSRNWTIRRQIESTFETVNWTLSDPFVFPENIPFGLYSIELNITSGKGSHSNTLYILYKKVTRPLQIYGGSIQSVKPSQNISLFDDEERQGDFVYLWCYHGKPISDSQPLFDLSLEGKVDCEPFTRNNQFNASVTQAQPSQLVQVFAISETDFREGRSLLRLTKVQQKKQALVNIRCIFNCNGQISAQINWVLQMNVDEIFITNDPSITYQWTLYKSESNIYNEFKKRDWIEGSDTPTLTIFNNSLPIQRWIKVCAQINGASFVGNSCSEFFSGAPPTNGNCHLSSPAGISVETDFIVRCYDYVDDGNYAFRKDTSQQNSYGIRYAVFYKSDYNMVLVYYGIFRKIGPFRLGAGINNTKLYINVYDIYYSFKATIIEMKGMKPLMSGDIEGLGNYLGNRISNIDHLQRHDQYVIINSVTGVVNKMKTTSLMQELKYDVKDMTRGKFLDFDLKTDTFKTWDEVMYILRDKENMKRIRVFSKIVGVAVERIANLVRPDDDAVDVMFGLGTLNLAISYFPYITSSAMVRSMKTSEFLLKRALQLCRKPIVSIFMTYIIDCVEILLGQLMSIINTDQIVLAKEGFAWKTVRKYMEKDQSFVNSSTIERAMIKSEIDEFERFYILQKLYLQSNIQINEKRGEAENLTKNLLNKQLHFLKQLIQLISPGGRQSRSQSRTFVCAKTPSGNKGSYSIGCGQMDVQINNDKKGSGNDTNVQVLSTNENLFTYDKDMRSALISLPTMILKNDNDANTGQSLNVKFGDPIETPAPSIPSFVAGDQAKLFYHRFLYRSAFDSACIRITPVKSKLGLLGYETYFRLLKPPNNDTFNYRTVFSRENGTSGYYQFCVPTGVFQTNGSLFVGLRPFFPAGVSGNDTELLAPYAFQAISANCLVWEKTFWSENVCKLIWSDHLRCDCPSRKQVILSNSFFVPPNVIDFSTVFSKFDIINNGTVFAVVMGTFLFFIIFFLIALKQDRKEEKMGHFRSLSDNYKYDNTYYILIVYTGLKVGAGTQSNICFLLSGERATSGVRSLSDDSHEGFKSGCVRKFLMSTHCSLGDLIFLKVWTDGSGKGEESSWFLDRFEVMEIDNEKKFLFKCNSWLSTDENGQPLYILPCNRFNDQLSFTYRFKEKMYNSLTDGHLWFSAYKRPCYSQFTRAQRVTCCVLVLYLTMIVNAMFYRSGGNLLKPNQITLGPLRFSLSQIAISFQSIAVVFPPTFLVLMFFKNSKPPAYKPSRSMKYGKDLKKEADEIFKEIPAEIPGNVFLPYWCVYIGWLLAFLAIGASGFFVILFSMEWGKTKSEEWMTTFILSSGESLFLVDPLKIFLIAFIIAFLSKKNLELKLTYSDNMSIMQEIYSLIYLKREKRHKLSIFPPMKRRERIKRQKRVEHEIWMKSILLNFVMYALLLWSSSSIAFTNRNPTALLFKEHLKRTFADPPKSTAAFSKITNVNSFYNWARTIVYPALFPVTDYAGNRLRWIDKKFINDGVNMKIGPIRLRQLRIQNPQTCGTYNFTGIRDCYPPYSFAREERDSYCLRWNDNLPCGLENVFNESLVAWSYTHANQIDHYQLPTIGIYNTYGGSGYIINLQVNNNISNEIQNELIRGLWIDRKTRAVFMEFTLYNANSNQFANFLFLVEFPEIGGAIPYQQINVITAYNVFDPHTVACLITFGLCLVMFMIKNAYNLLKERTAFFKNFWNLVDLCAFFTTSSVSAAYIMQYLGTQAVLEQFRKDPRVFVDFYRLVLWNQIITYNLAFQIFFTIIRVSCILGVSRRMSEIATVIKRCVQELVGVSFIFIVYTTAFVIVGNLCFPTLHAYRSYLSSLMTIFLLILGKNKFHEMVNVTPIIGKIYFMSNVFFMIFIILKMFESVLSDSISSKKNNKMQQSLLDLFMRQLKTSRMSHKSNAAQKKYGQGQVKQTRF